MVCEANTTVNSHNNTFIAIVNAEKESMGKTIGVNKSNVHPALRVSFVIIYDRCSI